MKQELQFRVRYIKTHAATVVAGQNTDLDWSITQTTYAGNNVNSYMEGVQYSIKNSHVDDELKFQVVHPVSGDVLDEFAHVAAMDGTHIIKEYLAAMYPGLILRLCYISKGTVNPEIKCNVLRHIHTGKQ